MKSKFLEFIILAFVSIFIFLVGLVDTYALSNTVNYETSTILGGTQTPTSEPIYQQTYDQDIRYIDDIRFKFTPDSNDSETDYRLLQGNTIEFIYYVCSTTDIRFNTGYYSNSKMNTSDGAIDLIYNNGNQCLMHNESNTITKIGYEYAIYMHHKIYMVDYNVATYPDNLPSSFTFQVKPNFNLVFDSRDEFYGFLRAYYAPSTAYYARVNALRADLNLEPVDTTGRITQESAIEQAEIDAEQAYYDSLNWYEKIIYKMSKGLQNLVDSLLNGLKRLFIPTDTSSIDNLNSTFRTKLGVIYSIPMDFLSFVISLVSTEWSDYTGFYLPEIELFGYKFWQEQYVDLTPFLNIIKPLRYVTSVLCLTLCMSTLMKWLVSFSEGNVGSVNN